VSCAMTWSSERDGGKIAYNDDKLLDFYFIIYGLVDGGCLKSVIWRGEEPGLGDEK